MSELSPQIVVAIGMVASVAAQLLKVYAEKKNKKLGRALVSWIVMGISFVVALFAYPVVWPALPSLADPTVFITGVAA